MAAEVCFGNAEDREQKVPPAHPPHATIQSIILRGQMENTFFSQDLPPFQKLGNTCGSYYRELHEQGVGAATKEMKV